MRGYTLGPALAAGNAAVIKPAEQTPLSALRLAALIEECGFPPGVVTGFGETTGAPLAAHPGIDTFTFTGSSEVGRRIAASAGNALKKTTLELGGTSPNIIFADADLDAAIEGAHGGVFFNQGQCCVAGSRLLVERSVVDEVLERLVVSAAAIQLVRVGGFVERAVSDGVTLVAGGGPAEVAAAPGGWFFTPTVLTGASQDQEIVREEVFGPVVAVTAFDDEDEAIAPANDTPYGLASGLWTTRLDRAHRVATPRRHRREADRFDQYS